MSITPIFSIKVMMSKKITLASLLIANTNCSTPQAIKACTAGLVSVNHTTITDPRTYVHAEDEVTLNGKIIKEGKQYIYLIFHKPVNYECTANRTVQNNIYEILPPEYGQLFPLGRLDKNSSGILLLTNNGSVYKTLVDKDATVEKKYCVTTLNPITADLQGSFEQPFLLGNRLTLPAKFTKTGEYSFEVILTEGINRHIRRICAKNKNQVLTLHRVQFGKYDIGNMESGHFLIAEKFTI